jgi:transcriptional regulator with XRE-family HTH domain
MSRSFPATFPAIAQQLAALGSRLRDARLRRELTTVLFAERIGVSRDTLNRLEKGDPNIAIGTYLKALRVLGLDQDIGLVAKDDVVGRKLQDRALPPRRIAKTSDKKPALTGHSDRRPAEIKSTRERNQKALLLLLKDGLKGPSDG